MKKGKGSCIWCDTLTTFATSEGKNMHFVCLKCYYWGVPKDVISAIVIGLWRKFKCMKLVLLLLCVILLSGCDAPITVAERSDQLLNDYNALLAECSEFKQKVDRLEKANAECTGLRDEHNALINDYSNLQTQYVVLEAYSQTIRDQYTALLEQFSTRYVDSGERYTEIYKQNMILTETYRELNEQIDAVHKENVPLLSDNLTETEYNAFYKGWRLWWGNFND